MIRKLSTLSPTINQQLKLQNRILETKGFIKSIRNSKKIGFIDISDGSSPKNLNIILKGNYPKNFQIGQTVSFKGDWVKSGKSQEYELHFDIDNPNHQFNIIGDIPEDYPLQKKSTTMQFLRTLPVLRNRTSTMSSMLRLRSLVEFKLMEFFNSEDVFKVTPPILTSSDCEGAGEIFKIQDSLKFFEKDSYLTVSTQLHLEVLSSALNRVWTLTPCFRAEKSNTSRHLSEFWMLEVELGYLNELEPLLKFTERMIHYIVTSLQTSNYIEGTYISKELIESRWNILLQEYQIMTYTDAITQLQSQGEVVEWGDSLQLKHEKMLASNGPVFITNYPAVTKPFYMKAYNAKTVECFDLLLPDLGELVGGSLREHDYDKLLQNMKDKNLNNHNLDWYLSLRKNGTMPHGGFGLGFERLIGYIAGLDNIKDVVPFPRSAGKNQYFRSWFEDFHAYHYNQIVNLNAIEHLFGESKFNDSELIKLAQKRIIKQGTDSDKLTKGDYHHHDKNILKAYKTWKSFGYDVVLIIMSLL
ncbi:unnamed protein product [Candida verbasci]|uniref:asparagine--tRNA ligase n=1 Tax=Candida verbasci TaxID=1227364 RepID=A0A9W4XIR5_9ASCO|nr:unnamed protein product [Candida verbasci]